VVNVDRISGTRTPTRTRLHAITTAAALAVVGVFALPASLSAPSQPVTASLASVAAPAAPDAAPAPDALAPAAPAPNPVAPAAPAADPVAPAPAPVPSVPTAQELHPVAISGAQQTFTPTAEQMSNAKAIVDAGKAMGLPPRAWTIAISTALQESNLHNIGDLGASNDHDSLGLFQQRPSSGWGTPDQIQNPTYAATAFYKGLVEVSGWQSMPLTNAAQKVQVSAYPDHYAKHEAQAGDMITALYGAGPHAAIAATIS
jgi:hypothetical protein